MTEQIVTINDVARLAQTSVTTVSNLLNGRVERMRPETRARIEEAMLQLGYQPSEIARRLKTGQTPILGLMAPSVANPFWGEFTQYAEESARKHGYQVLLGNTGRDPEVEERYANSLWAHGVRGVVFGSSPLKLDHLARLVGRGLRLVTFDRRVEAAEDASIAAAIDSVSVDNVAAAKLATDHLTALGHRRIGFLSGPLRTSSRLRRFEGYCAALAAAGAPFDRALVWEGDSGPGFGDVEGAELGRRGTRALLQLAQPPTAIFAINDMYALGAYAGARDAGLAIPDDLSIVGFDDVFFASLASPPLTTVRQPLREMLDQAVSLLIRRVEGQAKGPAEHRTIAAELIVRASTGPPAGAATTPGLDGIERVQLEVQVQALNRQ
jgi:DNA-binding LacI/PurR family transcriptional regulator